ncbi:hypothetical protein J3F83DRAFT_268573 [Trichoderma novae-zelandiae]
MEPPSNTAAVALSLPELVSRILAFCFHVGDGEDPRVCSALVAAIRVNRLWFDCGTEQLWSVPNASIHLRAVPPERQQIYAFKIENVEVWYTDAHRHWSAFRNLEFRRLKRLTATVPSNASFCIHQIKHFCVRSLQSFDFDGPLVSAEMLGLLREKCPNLKYIRLHMHKHPATTAPFAEFIRNMPLLETFVFKAAMAPKSSTCLIDGDLLASLARRKNLTTLQVPWDWPMSAADEASQRLVGLGSDREVRPFPSLVKLTLSAPSNAMQKLALLLKNLGCLRLTVDETDADAIEPLRELVNLTTLEVTFKKAVDIPGASIAALATLSKLEALQMKSLHPILIRITSSFSDADLELVASHWPRLRSLTFGINCAVSASGFQSLGLHCRELRQWEIAGPLQVDELLPIGFRDVVLFPKLEYLRFEGFAGVVYDRDSSWVGLLYFHCLFDYHFPQLKEIVTPHCRIRLNEHAFTETMLYEARHRRAPSFPGGS